MIERLLTAAAIVTILGCFIVVAFPDVFRPAPVDVIQCTPPTEYEQLHVILVWRDGRLAANCLYVGSRGTYSRDRRK